MRLVGGHAGATGSQQAVLGSGIQINRFSGPPMIDEVIGTIAMPAGRRYEELPLRGRDALVDELVAARSRATERVHVLHGLGGAGKSSVALEVACRIQEADGEVWWIPATDEDRVTMGMLILARRLGLSDAEIGHRDVADLVWQRLSDRRTPWLLVFDNADDLDVLTIDGAPFRDGTGWLRPFDSTEGMALVTSRHGQALDWGGWCHLHPVGMLSDSEGARVLMDETGPGPGTQAEAEALSRRLGGLPLALRLAGSYLAQSRRIPDVFADSDRPRTFTEYLAVVDNEPLEVAFPSQQQVQVPDREARQMLGRTWELSLELLERRGIASVRTLLQLMSCFADAPIPYEVLLVPAMLSRSRLFTTAVSGGEVWTALRALADTALIELPVADEPSPAGHGGVLLLRLHPLVRDASRPVGDEHRFLAAAAALVVEAANGETSGLPEDPNRWPLWQVLVPHALHLLDVVADLPGADDKTLLDAAKAAYMGARHLAARGAYAHAKAAYRDTRTVRERILGPDHQDTLNARYGVARMAAAQGDYSEAADAFHEILAARERVLGPDHPDTLNARYGIARMAAAQGRYAEAEEVYREILLATERTVGVDHPETFRARFGIARMAAEQGRFGDAEAIYRSMLNAQDAHAMASPLYDRAGAEQVGHLEAKTVYREVLAVEERVLGPDQPDGLTIRYAIARMAAAQGRYDEAEQAYREVYAVEENALGADHPDALNTRHWIGRMLNARGRHREAENLLREVLGRRRRVLGADHPNTLTTRYWVARALQSQGRDGEAEPLLREVLDARRRVLDAGHPHIEQTSRALERSRRRRDHP
jgi:tetratricopeptide (TPR) repeat protein